jgi:hypothetical protein
MRRHARESFKPTPRHLTGRDYSAFGPSWAPHKFRRKLVKSASGRGLAPCSRNEFFRERLEIVDRVDHVDAPGDQQVAQLSARIYAQAFRGGAVDSAPDDKL